MTQKFQIEYNGIDGSSIISFKTLGGIARYLFERDLGPEYRRSWGLQCEYGSLTFLDSMSWDAVRMAGQFVHHSDESWMYDWQLLEQRRKITFRPAQRGVDAREGTERVFLIFHRYEHFEVSFCSSRFDSLYCQTLRDAKECGQDVLRKHDAGVSKSYRAKRGLSV